MVASRSAIRWVSILAPVDDTAGRASGAGDRPDQTMSGMAAERVLMYHPDLPREKPVSVTRRAFDRAWSKNGWKQAQDDLSKLGKDELVAVAERAGVDTSGTKAEIVARLENQET